MYPHTETDHLITIRTLTDGLKQIGLRAGHIVIVHASMKAFGGYIVGGAQAVVEALMQMLTPDGTLVMPTFSNDNTDPAQWQNPPVPESWWETIRAEYPPYRPEFTPTRHMGAIVECFRTFPDVKRSAHPAFAFAAWGKNAEAIIADQPLDYFDGKDSPLHNIYELDGYVLLLGVGHGNNTSLHLAEHFANWPGRPPEEVNSAAMLDKDGNRVRVTYRETWGSDDDFPVLGADFEAETNAVSIGKIGAATVRFMRQRPIVDYAVNWMNTHRPVSLASNPSPANG